MKILKLWMLAAILTICGTIFFASCSGDNDDNLFTDSGETVLPETVRITDTIRYEEAKMTAYNIEYPSTDPYGKPVILSATITIGDEVTKEQAARGMLLYNHFTVYRADQCPSRGDLTVQKCVVGSGLICVSADYYGFGVTETKPQAYCVPSVNAQASVDALIAAKKLLVGMGYTWDDKLFNVGYSQGGQTTIGILKLVTEKYPDIRFTHSFAGGGPYDIPETYRQFIKSGETAMPATVVSVLQTYNDVFNLGIAWGDIFCEPVLSHLDEWFNSKRYSQKELENFIDTEQLSDIIQPTMLDLTSEQSRLFMTAMEQENLCHGWTPWKDEQVTIIHNISDGAVPVANAENLVAFFRAQGLPVSNDSKQSGVFVRIEDFGSLSAVPAHELGAVFFLSEVITKISDTLGINFWLTNSSLLYELIN